MKEAKHAYLALRGYFALGVTSDVRHMMANSRTGYGVGQLSAARDRTRDGDEERAVVGVSMLQ